MQPMKWYFKRLARMSPEEIAWRVRGAVRDRADRLLVGRRRRRAVSAILRGDCEIDRRGFRVSDMPVGAWAGGRGDRMRRAWRETVQHRADEIAQGKLSFFDLTDKHLGDPIDWNRDHKHDQPSPMTFAGSIDYRDFRLTGDCKFVWEPSRHHQLVVLGRAYRASGEVRYAQAVVDQLDSWLQQCPYGAGMQWRSPLELAIRLINWVWALDLIGDAGLIDEAFHLRVLKAADLHLWEIARKYSRGSSSNNHLIGEAAGVFVASSYFASLARAQAVCAESRRILSEQACQQTFADGGGREQAVGYQLFTLQFFLIAGLVARKMDRDFSPHYWQAVGKSVDFLTACQAGGGYLWRFGDCDDGYVLDLGSQGGCIEPWLAVAAAMLGRSDVGGIDLARHLQPAVWLLDAGEVAQLVAPARPTAAMLGPRAFEQAGYYLLQCGSASRGDRISVAFDCGPLGYESIAAHGHADALSVTVRAFGEDVLVDPGTYDYFSYPKWRDYFRSTRAHNTVEVDQCDQSVMDGPFLWSRHAKARCLKWEPECQGGRVVGEHDGYARLEDPAIHRRTVELDAAERTVTIRDEIIAEADHDMAVWFHFGDRCRVTPVGAHRVRAEFDGGTAMLDLDRRLSVRTHQGEVDPVAGWVSYGYHRKNVATSVVGTGRAEAGRAFVCRLRIASPAEDEGES